MKTVPVITHLEENDSGTVNEKEVRYAIRALHDLLGDEEEARMVMTSKDYDALMRKLEETLGTVKNIDVSKETVEDLEEVVGEVSNTSIDDGVNLTTITVGLEEIKVMVEELAPDPVDSDDEKVIEADKIEEVKEVAGDADNAGDLQIDDGLSNDSPAGHSDERLNTGEKEETEEQEDYSPVLQRLRMIALGE